MSNLTITVDENVLKKARLKALEQGTSVNAVLRGFLEVYAGVQREQRGALQDLLGLSESTRSRRGQARWSRDELHDRRS